MTTHKRSVSVVIPTFNRANMLNTAIDSALRQTYPCEVIVVNHGSTDYTDEVALSYGKKIKYIKRKNDFGPHFAWLDGVLHANGEYIHLQYDDDWIEPDFLEECIALFSEDIGFVFSCANIFDQGSSQITQVLFEDWADASGAFRSKQFEHKIMRSLISPAAAVYRKQILLDALYQGRLPLSDAEYHGVGPDCLVTLLSILRFKKIGFVKRPLATFRAHDASITTAANREKEKAQEIRNAYDEVKRYYSEMKFLRFLRGLTLYRERKLLVCKSKTLVRKTLGKK
ncbi:glycosyltransferase [Amylibacter sp.]|nr:glycosyltransferase [Amylibacter sp.]